MNKHDAHGDPVTKRLHTAWCAANRTQTTEEQGKEKPPPGEDVACGPSSDQGYCGQALHNPAFSNATIK